MEAVRRAIPGKPAVIKRTMTSCPHGAREVFIPPSRAPGTGVARHDISRGEKKISLSRLGALREQVQIQVRAIFRDTGFCISGIRKGWMDGW